MTPSRYHGLDLLRGIAMLLGLVTHTSLVYTMPEIFAGITGRPAAAAPDLSTPTQLAMAWLHMWRMPLFFILAGFFAALVVARRGPLSWGLDRATRVALPLVVFGLGWNLLVSQPLLNLDHFWFLYFLAAMCGLTVLGHALGLRAPARLLWLFDRPARLLILLPVFAALTAVGREDGFKAIIPETFGEFPPGAFLYHYAWFLAGQALYARREVIARLSHRIGWLAAIALPAFAAQIIASQASLAPLLVVAAAITTGATSLFLIGLAERVIRAPTRLGSFLVETAYPTYLLHLLPVMVISGWLVVAGLPEIGVFALTTPLAFGVCLILYVLFIKYTPLNWLLAGYAKSWAKLPRLRTA